jgi:hypothetical protein
MQAEEHQAMQASQGSIPAQTIEDNTNKRTLDSTTMSLTLTLPEGADIQRNYKPDGSLDLTKRWTKVMHQVLNLLAKPISNLASYPSITMGGRAYSDIVFILIY